MPERESGDRIQVKDKDGNTFMMTPKHAELAGYTPVAEPASESGRRRRAAVQDKAVDGPPKSNAAGTGGAVEGTVTPEAGASSEGSEPSSGDSGVSPEGKD